MKMNIESPKEFYDSMLKGQASDFIEARIEDLKDMLRKIDGSLKSSCVEYGTVSCVGTESTGEKTLAERESEIAVVEELRAMELQKLKLAYIELGRAMFRESNELYPEEKKRIFEEKLDHLEYIRIHYDNFWDVSSQAVYKIDGYQVLAYSGNDQIFPKTMDLNKYELLNALKQFDMWQWNDTYYNHDILDGTSWSFNMKFKDGYEGFTTEGYMDYPPHFKELAELLCFDEYVSRIPDEFDPWSENFEW